MWQRAMSSGGGMTVTHYPSPVNKSTTYSVQMNNGVYLLSRTGSAQNNSYIKGYVENGILNEIFTATGIIVSYSNGTLTIDFNGKLTSQTDELYFFVVD